MNQNFDFAIVGGGLAGLTAALHLSQNSFKVIVFEKNTYPHHKVCGEYISNEVLPYLLSLGIDPFQKKAQVINRLMLTHHNGQSVSCDLPLGGFGISRFCFDNFLYEKVKHSAQVVFETVTQIQQNPSHFVLETQTKKQYQATRVIGAYGKRSRLDINLKRSFIKKKTPWLAFKGHYQINWPQNLVALHHFEGGYCGISSVENKNVNCCYLVNKTDFSKHNTIKDFQNKVMQKNPFLNQFFKEATPIFEKPLSISQISFERKKPVSNHIFMIGDSAALIHPLCGNGMAMAIKSAQLLALTFIENKNASTRDYEKIYTSKWEHEFSNRLRAGAFFQKIVMRPKLLLAGIKWSKYHKSLIPFLVAKTHGKPF